MLWDTEHSFCLVILDRDDKFVLFKMPFVDSMYITAFLHKKSYELFKMSQHRKLGVKLAIAEWEVVERFLN